MKKRFLFILALVIAFISACTERIDIKLDEGTVRLVVEGSVTTDTTAHKIFLTKTTSFYYNQPAPPVTGALVTITYSGKTVVLTESSPGVYETEPGFSGAEGERYDLDIKLTEPVGGFTGYTASSTMGQRVEIDSALAEFRPNWSDEGMWEIKGFFRDPPEEDYYRFLIYRNDTLVTDTLDKWYTTDDRFFNGQYVTGTTVAVLDQSKASERLDSLDVLTVEMDCVSKNFYDFIQEAQAELRGSNPLFSGPPANVKGNISNGAIGYFSAYSTSRTRRIIRQ